jgi:L-asparagine oxygenase
MSISATPHRTAFTNGYSTSLGITPQVDSVRGARIEAMSPHVMLNSQEVKQLEKLATYLTAKPDIAPEEFCRQAWRASVNLPKRLIEALYSFERWGSPSGVLVISGIEVSDVPETPQDNSENVAAQTSLARIQAICNEMLGRMVAYEAEGSGRLFQDMVPAKGAKRAQTSLSSEVELEVHTEQAFSALRPDYLSLACLRGDPNAQTYVLRAVDVLAHVSPDTARMLRRPLWTMGVDESFRIGEHKFVLGDVRGPVPIISGSINDPTMVLDQDLMDGVDGQARQVLGEMRELYMEYRHPYTLSPGQILILDNNRVAHGRSNFAARFDGTDRFIIRSFVVRDLMKSLHAREGGSRTIAARFS